MRVEIWCGTPQYATLRDVASPRLVGVRALSAVVGGLGPSSLCPTGVLPLLGVIAASRGYDLAVVDFNAQQYRRTDRRAIPAD